MCGGKYYAVLLEIFILYSAVKEFWKSVKIWESYCQKFDGFLFLEHGVCCELLHYFKFEVIIVDT